MFKTLLQSSTRGSLRIIKVAVICLLSFILAIIAGYFLFNYYSTLANFKQNLAHYSVAFIALRLAVIALITWFWPYYINMLLKKAKNKGTVTLDEDEMLSRQWLKSRWLILALLLSIELMLNLNSIINLF